MAQSPTPPPVSAPPAVSAMPAAKAQVVAQQAPDQLLASKFKGTDVIGADNQLVSDSTWNYTYDAEGNSGTRSSLVIQLNEHTVLPPSSVTAGWNDLMGGVDIQWLPSVDQDVLYYTVWHKYGNNPAVQVTTCGTGGEVSGTSCTDTGSALDAPPLAALRPTCTNPQQSYTTTNYYYVIGWDTDPSTGNPRAIRSHATASNSRLSISGEPGP